MVQLQVLPEFDTFKEALRSLGRADLAVPTAVQLTGARQLLTIDKQDMRRALVLLGLGQVDVLP